MSAVNLNELLSDANLHSQGQVTVFEYRGNKIQACSGRLITRQSGAGMFMGTDGDIGYNVDNRHLIVKDTCSENQSVVHYRVMHDEVEILDIVFS